MYDPVAPLLRNGAQLDGLPQPDAKARFAEDRLLDAVLWCDVMPGDVITESDVMGRFGLSRAAARAALTRLGYDGWAEPHARMGWLVAPVTGELISEVLAARRMTEPEALARASLNDGQLSEMRRIGGILETLRHHRSGSGVITFRHFVDEVDSLLLSGIDRFSARHLRKLWHHSARMTRYLEDTDSGELYRRDDIFALIQAVLAREPTEIAKARHALIASQETFFLRQMLKSKAALSSGSRLSERIRLAATNRRSS